jgi:hypothetical protein
MQKHITRKIIAPLAIIGSSWMASMAAADEIQLCYDPNYVISFPPTIKKVEVATNAVIAFDNDTFKNPSEVELLVARFDSLTAKHFTGRYFAII